MNSGMLLATGAYFIWGLFPIYWKLLRDVPALQLLCHRIVWSLFLLLIIILIRGEWGDFLNKINRHVIKIYALAAIFIGVNWFFYLWAVKSNFIVEASFGYFISPLFSVLLGILFLREKIRLLQLIPLGMVILAVVYLAIGYGRFPWIALILAFTFSSYGFTKKIAKLNSLYGLKIETGILSLPALCYLIIAEIHGLGAFGHLSVSASLLLVGTGIVTTVPLLMFALAARNLSLAKIGLLQYISPTLQFLLGIFLYHEPFGYSQLICFGIIWMALIIFWLENYFANRNVVCDTSPVLVASE